MVVFGDNVILFSDKHSAYPNHPDPKIAWRRWHKRAIQKSVNQLHGAEQWLLNERGPLFLDPKCSKQLPVELPSLDRMTIHLVAVTRGSHDQCEAFFGGGSSGSFMLNNTISFEERASKPFQIGWQLPRRRFTHVFDELALEVTLRELDTVADFLDYLSQKECLLSPSWRPVIITGEEDLVAEYQTAFSDADGKHSLPNPPPGTLVSVEEGSWRKFVSSEEYQAKKIANQVSYIWDKLIEYQTGFIQEGTALSIDPDTGEDTPGTFDNQETIVRTLAEESRFHRRLLSESLNEVVHMNLPPMGRFARIVLQSANPRRAHVFVVMSRPRRWTYDSFRDFRRATLIAYCNAVKLKYPNVSECVGIASEPASSRRSSQDFFFVELGSEPLSGRQEEKLLAMCKEHGIHKPGNMKEIHRTAYEFAIPGYLNGTRPIFDAAKKMRTRKREANSKRKSQKAARKKNRK